MPTNTAKIKIIVEGAPTAKQQLDQLKQATDKVNKAGKQYSRSAKSMRGVTAGLTRSIGQLRNSILLVTFAFGGMLGLIRKTTGAYRKQVEAEAKLAASMRNVQGATEGGIQKLIEYAGELQKVTTFGDENIISGMAMLATFQLNEDAIAKLTPRLLDMAAAQPGVSDLATTAIQLGKAFTGMPSALTRSGIVIDKVGLSIARAKGPTEEFNFLIEQMDNNFKGVAESLAQTTIGQLDKLENEIGDINEQTGKIALPAELGFAKFKKEAANFLSFYTTVIAKTMDSNISLNQAWGIAIANQKALLEEANIAFEEYQATRTNEIAKEMMLKRQSIDLLGEELQLSSDGNLSLQDKLDLLETQRQNLDELAGIGAAPGSGAALPELISEEEHQKGIIENDIKRIALQKQLAEAKAKATSTMLGSFAALNTAAGGNAKVSARLAQSAAIIDMFAGANKAFAQGGILGFATAASIIAAGTANIIQIEKQMAKMNKAALGTDFVTDGPQMLLVGEQGRERVNVTPLEGPNVMGGSTGNVNITFTGNVLSNEFVMDEVLPQIQEAAQINLA